MLLTFKIKINNSKNQEVKFQLKIFSVEVIWGWTSQRDCFFFFSFFFGFQWRRRRCRMLTVPAAYPLCMLTIQLPSSPPTGPPPTILVLLCMKQATDDSSPGRKHTDFSPGRSWAGGHALPLMVTNCSPGSRCERHLGGVMSHR